jgi:large subunit ribosomal protein L10
MTKAEKSAVIEELKEVFASSNCFYVTDCSALTVEHVNNLRRTCFEQGIQLRVIKNTLIRKALEQVSDTQYTELYSSLEGPTAIMFAETGNAPARLIKAFREKHDKPVVKAAYIDSAIFVGDDQLDNLTKLKSRDELIGEIVGLLQSPATNVISALQSAGGKLAGILKTLEERA